MTQEEKTLLLKDLCARLPYGVIVHRTYIWGEKIKEDDGELEVFDMDSFKNESVEKLNEQGCTIKPYLRPMSSMTEEEIDELLAIIKEESGVIVEQLKNNDCGIKEKKYHFNSYKELDWILAHHFDYRGLIPMGLALEAKEEMYKTV